MPYLLAFTLAVAAVGCFLRWHISHDYEEEILSWQARLSGVADDQAQRVSDWLKERQGDAKDSSSRPSIRAVLRVYNQGGQLPKIPSASRSETLSALDDLATSYSYAGVYILDRDAHVVMQSSRSIPLNPMLAESCRAVARAGLARTELVGDTPMQTLVGFIAPVFPGPAAADRGQPSGQPLGIVLLVSDASQTLFPLVAREVVPTRTSETVLVRREGNEIIYFSPLRHIPVGSSNLRFSFSSAPVPTRLALEGHQTFVQYNDYRGVPVLAATQYIPLTGWGLVRKIDRAEALADFRRMALLESLAAGLLVVLFGGVLLFFRWYMIARVRKREEEKFRALLESAPDAIYIIEPSTLRILGRNRRAAEMDGYSDEEISHMTAADLPPPEGSASTHGKLEKGPGAGSVLPLRPLHHRRKNGQLVPVEENQTLIDAGGERLILSIVHDITERNRTEMELRQSEEHFHSLFENMLNGFAFCQMHFEQDQPRDFTYLEVNHAFETLTGLKDVVGRKVSEVIPGLRESDPDVFELYGRVALTGKPERMEIFVDALGMWFSIAAYSPKKEHFVAIFDVITERKRAEEELQRVNRALRTISDCNKALVRAAEEPVLLKDVCEILVRVGGYRMAWVGFAEHDDSKTVRPAAHTGFEDGYLETANITWADTERGRGPTGTAIRTGKPVVVRFIQQEPNLAPWREEALKRGYASSIALPIRLNDNVVGALTVYAEEPDAFDSAEMQLLAELADDLAYGIQTLRTKAERNRAEEALIEERHLLRTLMDNLPDWIYFKDRESRFTRINKALAEKFGLDNPAQAVGKTDLDFIAAEHASEFHNDDAEVLRTGQSIVDKEESGIWPDGHVTWISTTKMPVRDAQGNIIGTFGVSRDITERKRVEAALRESEERFRSLVENATVGIYRTTPQGRILMANRTLVSMLGYTDFAALAARNLEEDGFEPGYSRREFRERIERDGEVRGLEEGWTRPDGSVIFVRESARAIRGEDGKILYYDGIVEDITERKRAEEALRRSEACLAAGESLTHTGSWSWNVSTGEFFWSQETYRIFGFDPAKDKASIRDTFLARIHPEDRASVEAGLRSPTAQDAVEYRIVLPDGSIRHVQDIAYAVTDATGETVERFGVACDITERKRAEAEHIRLVTAIEQSAEAVVITNTDGDIEYVNPAFTRITGYSREEVLGQNPRILKSGKQDPEFYQQLWETILKGQTWHGELINRRKDGSLYTEQMNIAPVRDARGEVTHFIATKQDVTERKTLEAQLQQAAKMEAVGRLAGGVAHDFNNLLTVINGYSELLLEKFGV